MYLCMFGALVLCGSIGAMTDFPFFFCSFICYSRYNLPFLMLSISYKLSLSVFALDLFLNLPMSMWLGTVEIEI